MGIDNQDSTKLKLFPDWNFAGSTIMTWNRANGNVGIGTTTPSRKLDVNGDCRMTSDL